MRILLVVIGIVLIVVLFWALLKKDNPGTDKNVTGIDARMVLKQLMHGQKLLTSLRKTSSNFGVCVHGKIDKTTYRCRIVLE